MSESHTDDKEPPTFDFMVGRSVKCRVLERINHGSYGMIHKGVLLEDNAKVVVKLENQKNNNQMLLREANIVRQLAECPGIAKVFWYGLMDPYYNVMVMQELGQSLQQLFSYCDHKFTLDTVVNLASQMIDILQYIHGMNIVHRDIKPDNFLMGHQYPNRVYLIDFGLSNTYERCRSLRRTSSLSFQRSLVGTSRYASLHAHRCELAAPRDDLESLGYCFVYFLKGALPWQYMHLGDISRDEHNHAIQKVKTEITLDDLCEGISPAIKGYLDFARLLKFADIINYERLKRKFISLSSSSDLEQFDWTRKHEATGDPIQPHDEVHGHNTTSDK